MRVRIAWFSATGNTWLAVTRVAATLTRDGHEVELRAIARTEPDAPGDSFLVVAFPTHAWSPPSFVLRWVRRLPRTSAGRAAVLAVDGGGCYGAPDVMARALRRRGYHVDLIGSASFSENWAQVMNAPDDHSIASQTARGLVQVDAFSAELSRIVAETSRSNTRDLVAPSGPRWAYVLTRLVGWPYRLFGRRFLGKFFVADDDCTSCGLCARTCPVGAIRMRGRPSRPVWRFSCVSCNRCVNECPTGAITSSFGRVVVLVFAIAGCCVAAVIAWTRLGSPLIAELPGALRVALDVVAIVAALVLGHIAGIAWFDRLVVQPFQRTRAGRFLERGFTKGFRRYWVRGYRPDSGGANDR